MAKDTPQILQGLVDSADPAAQAAAGPQKGPVETQSATPPAQPIETTPYEDQGGTLPTHPVDNMAMAFMGHLLDNQKNGVPTPPPAPGSFGSKLQGALSAAAEGLGDMRTGGDPGQGHGWLSAVGATLNARSQRLEHLKEVTFDQQERLKNDQINLAQANANLVQHARAVQMQDKVVRDVSAASGAKFMDTLRSNYKVRDNIGQDDLMKMAQEDPKFLQTHTARITGYEPVLDASGNPRVVNGVPVETPKYSVADIAPGDMSKQYTVDAFHAKKWADAGLRPVEAGTVMPASMSNQMDVQAERYGTTLSLLNLAKVQPLPDAVKDQMVSALNDPEVQHAVAMQPGNVLGGLFDAQANVTQHLQVAQQQLAAAQASKDPNKINAAQQQLQAVQATQKNLDQTINSGFTDKERSDYAKQVVADRKQTETEQQNKLRDEETKRHNIADEEIKRLEASGGAPEVLQDMGQKLADAEMVPSQLSKRSKNYNASWVAADKASWGSYGKPYDGAQAESEYKYSTQKSTQDTLKLINGIVDKGGSLEIAQNAAVGLPGMDQQTLNKVFSAGKTEFGSKAITDFHTAMLGLADEYSKVMGGGVSSDTGRQQSLDLLKDAYSKGQMAGAIAIVKKDITARQRGIIGKNRFLQKQYYGANGMTVTMVSPDGKSYAEVPRSQAQARLSQGARIATKDDWDRLGITAKDH